MEVHGLKYEEITEKVIGVFFDVYNELGYGFLESVYEKSMLVALAVAGLTMTLALEVRNVTGPLTPVRWISPLPVRAFTEPARWTMIEPLSLLTSTEPSILVTFRRALGTKMGSSSTERGIFTSK